MAEKKLITVWNETKTLVDWAEDDRCSVCANTISCRINRGWDPERAVSTPVQANGADFDYSKLDEKDIPEIFRLREEEDWTFRELADQFGVTAADIGYVLHGVVWDWVDHDYVYTGGRIWTDRDGGRRKIYGTKGNKYPGPGLRRFE